MTERHGLVIVHTGNGKGKTTAALGMGLRAWGQGYKVLILQFIKGNWKYGELLAAEMLGENFVIRQLGEGFVFAKGGDEDTLKQHKAAAAAALGEAKTEIVSGKWDLIILDEINYAIKFGLVSEAEAIELIAAKSPELHLVLTGRDAATAIIDRADLVTEMREIKHPLQKGIKAQVGIEF